MNGRIRYCRKCGRMFVQIQDVYPGFGNPRLCSSCNYKILAEGLEKTTNWISKNIKIYIKNRKK